MKKDMKKYKKTRAKEKQNEQESIRVGILGAAALGDSGVVKMDECLRNAVQLVRGNFRPFQELGFKLDGQMMMKHIEKSSQQSDAWWQDHGWRARQVNQLLTICGLPHHTRVDPEMKINDQDEFEPTSVLIHPSRCRKGVIFGSICIDHEPTLLDTFRLELASRLITTKIAHIGGGGINDASKEDFKEEKNLNENVGSTDYGSLLDLDISLECFVKCVMSREIDIEMNEKDIGIVFLFAHGLTKDLQANSNNSDLDIDHGLNLYDKQKLTTEMANTTFSTFFKSLMGVNINKEKDLDNFLAAGKNKVMGETDFSVLMRAMRIWRSDYWIGITRYYRWHAMMLSIFNKILNEIARIKSWRHQPKVFKLNLQDDTLSKLKAKISPINICQIGNLIDVACVNARGLDVSDVSDVSNVADSKIEDSQYYKYELPLINKNDQVVCKQYPGVITSMLFDIFRERHMHFLPPPQEVLEAVQTFNNEQRYNVINVMITYYCFEKQFFEYLFARMEKYKILPKNLLSNLQRTFEGIYYIVFFTVCDFCFVIVSCVGSTQKQTQRVFVKHKNMKHSNMNNV